jgi:methylsterol monooxygenase
MISYWLSSALFIYKDKVNMIYEKHGKEMYFKSIKISLLNQFMITLPITFLLRNFIKNSIEQSIQNSIGISLLKIFLIGNMSNFIFYWVHRLLHTKYLYRYIHSIHHQYIIPIAPAALYAHPIEHIMCNNFAFIIPFIFIGLRYDFLLYSIILGSMYTTLAHTNYDISLSRFNIIYDKNEEMSHYIHHKKFNYNYGFGSILDKIFGTHKN